MAQTVDMFGKMKQHMDYELAIALGGDEVIGPPLVKGVLHIWPEAPTTTRGKHVDIRQ